MLNIYSITGPLPVYFTSLSPFLLLVFQHHYANAEKKVKRCDISFISEQPRYMYPALWTRHVPVYMCFALHSITMHKTWTCRSEPLAAFNPYQSRIFLPLFNLKTTREALSIHHSVCVPGCVCVCVCARIILDVPPHLLQRPLINSSPRVPSGNNS